ncbi:MAG: hypothetical protein GY760_21125, partial [Deltaproteobacteria bacterium]|nr:hypothetical protein [Deltaproteobacteria bacterium]
SSTVVLDDYTLLMDYILEQPDEVVAQMDDDSIYIDHNGNICTGSLEQNRVLQYNNTYSAPSIPGDDQDEVKEPVEQSSINDHEGNDTDNQWPTMSDQPFIKPIDIGKDDDSDFICVDNTINKTQDGNWEEVNDYSNFNNIQTNLVNTPEADNFQADTQVNTENISVNNLISQSHELHSAFTDDEVFKVNRIKRWKKERKEHPPAEGNLINENSPIEDVQDFNVNTKSGVTQKLSQYNLKDRFINYILLKFPYVDIERLITLQQTDPYFQIIIEKCNSFSNKTCYKQGKHGFSFTLRQGILLRTYKSQEGLDRLQICCPKITLPDTLLTLHRQPNSIHIGIKKLCDKFEECFYSPDTRSYAIQVVENCFLCQSNLPIKRRIRGDYLSGLKLTLQGPRYSLVHRCVTDF